MLDKLCVLFDCELNQLLEHIPAKAKR
nr:hypothetical protein [Leucothrix pacifica]